MTPLKNLSHWFNERTGTFPNASNRWPARPIQVSKIILDLPGLDLPTCSIQSTRSTRPAHLTKLHWSNLPEWKSIFAKLERLTYLTRLNPFAKLTWITPITRHTYPTFTIDLTYPTCLASLAHSYSLHFARKTSCPTRLTTLAWLIHKTLLQKPTPHSHLARLTKIKRLDQTLLPCPAK